MGLCFTCKSGGSTKVVGTVDELLNKSKHHRWDAFGSLFKNSSLDEGCPGILEKNLGVFLQLFDYTHPDKLMQKRFTDFLQKSKTRPACQWLSLWTLALNW